MNTPRRFTVAIFIAVLLVGCRAGRGHVYSEELTLDLLTGTYEPRLVDKIERIDVYLIKESDRWYGESVLDRESVKHVTIYEKDAIDAIVRELRYADPGIKTRNLVMSEAELHIIFSSEDGAKAYVRVGWGGHSSSDFWAVKLYAPVAYQVVVPLRLKELMATEPK